MTKKSNIRWWLGALGFGAGGLGIPLDLPAPIYLVYLITNTGFWYLIGLAIDAYREKQWKTERSRKEVQEKEKQDV